MYTAQQDYRDVTGNCQFLSSKDHEVHSLARKASVQGTRHKSNRRPSRQGPEDMQQRQKLKEQNDLLQNLQEQQEAKMYEQFLQQQLNTRKEVLQLQQRPFEPIKLKTRSSRAGLLQDQVHALNDLRPAGNYISLSKGQTPASNQRKSLVNPRKQNYLKNANESLHQLFQNHPKLKHQIHKQSPAFYSTNESSLAMLFPNVDGSTTPNTFLRHNNLPTSKMSKRNANNRRFQQNLSLKVYLTAFQSTKNETQGNPKKVSRKFGAAVGTGEGKSRPKSNFPTLENEATDKEPDSTRTRDTRIRSSAAKAELNKSASQNAIIDNRFGISKDIEFANLKMPSFKLMQNEPSDMASRSKTLLKQEDSTEIKNSIFTQEIKPIMQSVHTEDNAYEQGLSKTMANNPSLEKTPYFFK